jgi:hypothetical protein
MQTTKLHAELLILWLQRFVMENRMIARQMYGQ